MSLVSTPNPVELEKALREFVGAALRQAASDAKARVIFPSSVTRMRISGDGAERTQEMSLGLRHHAGHLFKNLVARRKEAEPLLEQIEAYPGCSAYGARWRKSNGEGVTARFAATRLLLGFARFVSAEEEWVIDESRWSIAWNQLQELLTNCRAPYQVLAPLHGVRVTQAIDLDGVALRPMTESERDGLVGVGSWAFADGADCEVAFVIEEITDVGAKPNPSPNTNADRNKAEDALLRDVELALQLWCNRSLGIALIRRGQCFWDTWSANVRRLNLSHPEELEDLDDIDGFRQFWRRTRDVFARPPRGLEVALSRYRLMQEHPRAVDRLLDQIIIMEALFQKGDEKQELSYRLSLRVAHFIGDTHEERLRVFREMKAAYKLRSKLAHGSAVENTAKGVQAFADRAVRDALIRYCRRAAVERDAKIQSKICEELDSRLLERHGDE